MSDTEFIVIIRPSFKKFCKDACRAAALNHLLFRIAYKCKDQAKEKVQNGEVLWYATNEQITEEMSHAWGTCKVGKEINALIEMGLIGRTNDPTWGVNRTKHFFFGKEQCNKFIQICEEHAICLVHLDLPPEVKHLLYTTLAIDKSIKCSCKEGEGNLSNHQMQFINSSDAFDKSIEAITKKDYKDNNKEKSTYDADASLPHVFSDDELLTLLRERGYSVTNQPELSTPIVDKSEPEQVATRNPIASDDPQPTQDENGSHKQPPHGRAQPEKKPRAPRVQKPEKVVLTPQGQAFYTLYCSMPWVKIPPEITEKGREQCEKLGTTLTTQEQMFQLRNYMGKKAFFKGKGFSFALMIMAVNDMASEQPVSSVQAELQAAAPGFEVKSQVDLMRMMPEERRDYAKRLNAHLAANRTEKEKQALEYALKLEIV